MPILEETNPNLDTMLQAMALFESASTTLESAICHISGFSLQVSMYAYDR